MELKEGAVFVIVICPSAKSPSETPSLGVTRTIHISPFVVSEEAITEEVWVLCRTLFLNHS